MRNMSAAKGGLAFGVFMLLLIVAEVACARLAWHTVGEIHSALLMCLVWLNFAPPLFYLLKFKKLAVGLALFGAVLIVPHQVFLGHRWHLLQQETLSIAAYVNRVKKQRGSYPKTLAAYRFLYPSLQPELTYEYYKPSDYAVHFHIGSPNTEHWYEAGSGWWYYPD